MWLEPNIPHNRVPALHPPPPDIFTSTCLKYHLAHVLVAEGGREAYVAVSSALALVGLIHTNSFAKVGVLVHASASSVLRPFWMNNPVVTTGGEEEKGVQEVI